MRLVAKGITLIAMTGMLMLAGCGGGGGGSSPSGPPVSRGVMGEASPFTGYLEFKSTSTCKQNGYYVTLEFTEDTAGNLSGKLKGRYVSPSQPPPSGDGKYTGPLNANITGKRENGQVMFTLTGDIKGTFGGDLTSSSGFSKISGEVNDQPGCSDANGSTHNVKVFLLGDELPQI